MNNSNDNGHPWNKTRIIVLLPLIILVWMTGWTLYWIGTQSMSSRTAKKKGTTAFKK